MINSALSDDSNLSALKGFKMNLSANQGFRKFFFAARCECGTSALLSVEVASNKTLAEIEEAVPKLARKMETQAKSFRSMPCDTHRRIRMGQAAEWNTGANA